ncbi:MAG: hypothetical protein IJP89_05275 [Synergistaceae bacterium]|nr:hypothetical protein [Synergistaceae bacterium]
MKHSKGLLTALITLSALLFLAVISGGCGGSSSGTNPQNPQASSSRCVLIGDITASRFASSDLTPYVRQRITETASFADPEALFYTLESLTSKDFLFLGNIADSSLDTSNPGQAIAFLGGVAAAYQKGATIVLVYPDSADVQAMNEFLNLSLAEPDEDAPYKAFELLAASMRELSGGNRHVFTYVANCDGNTEYFSNVFSRDITEDVAVDSGDAPVNTTAATAYDIVPAAIVNAEELHNELCEARVQKLFDWQAGLDARAEEMGASVSAAVNKFVNDAALENELLSIAQGMTTDYDDTFSMSFIDYYNKYMKDNNSAQNVINRLGLKDSNSLNAYSGLSVKRDTNSHYQVINLHSFDTHKDYYLILSRAITQPKAIQVRSTYGSTTGGEIAGHPSVLGYTAKLYTDVWASTRANRLERYLPDQTVNQSRSYTDSSGWSTTRAVSTTNSIETSVNAEAGTEGGSVGTGMTAGHSVTYAYENSVSHTSEMTWTAQDYEIVPTPYNSYNRRVARWRLDVADPKYSYNSRNWLMSTASRSSVTLNTESIFWASMDEADNVKLYGQAMWCEGFIGVNNDGWSSLWKWMEGQYVTLNFTRPLHTALLGATYEGSRDDVMYTATLLTEANWTAESDSDWLMLSSRSKSGGAGSSTIRYEVSENTTGKMREGTITITSGRDKVLIPFTQSAGRYINDK